MRPLPRLGPLGPLIRQGGPVFCGTPGCLKTTREGKPHCPDHVEDHAYVQEILSQLAARDRELENVSKRGWRAVTLDGITATEILLYLRIHGERTVERVRREHLLSRYPKAVTRAYAQALANAKRVTVGRTTRGSLCLRAK